MNLLVSSPSSYLKKFHDSDFNLFSGVDRLDKDLTVGQMQGTLDFIFPNYVEP